jgi:hypothetical protein
MVEASQAMTPPEQRRLDAVEQAASRARQVLAQVAEERRADDEAEAAARERLRAERAAAAAAA